MAFQPAGFHHDGWRGGGWRHFRLWGRLRAEIMADMDARAHGDSCPYMDPFTHHHASADSHARSAP